MRRKGKYLTPQKGKNTQRVKIMPEWYSTNRGIYDKIAELKEVGKEVPFYGANP